MGGPPAPCLCDQTSHLSSQPEPPPLPLLKPPEVDVDPSSVSQSTVGGSPFLPRLWGCRQRMASQAGQAVTGDGDTGHVSAPSLHRGCPGHLELHHSPDPRVSTSGARPLRAARPRLLLELPPYSCWPVLYGTARILHG